MRVNAFCLILFGVFIIPRAYGLPATAAVTLRTLHTRHQLFGQIVPQHQYWVTTSLNGRIEGLRIQVGDSVHQGDVIARLTGPSVNARLQAARLTVKQDQAELVSAKSVLTLTAQKRRQKLATQEQLLNARTALLKARTQLAIGRSQQQSLQAETQLLAPTDGQVAAVTAANGDYISAGESLLKLLPSKGLWLEARAYGRDGQQVTVGQTGQFLPEEGGQALAVTVATRVPDTESPGSWLLFLVPKGPSTDWFAGQAGTVTLTGGARQLPAVPSAGLIMDQGQWWVMLKTRQGAKPVQVDPAASQNGWTWLLHGVQAGQEVMVQGAYQAYHQDFSKQYANPD